MMTLIHGAAGVSLRRAARSALLAPLFAAALGTPAARATDHQAAMRPIVVELFTSEGCSSCPPADALLTELARDRADVLPLALHVTYWNSLGWRDPFSFDAATARQRDYALARGSNEVFTPELVVEGRASVVGSDREAVAGALARAAHPSGPPITLDHAGASLRIAIGAGAGRGRVELVGFDAHHRTAIGRGENAGRSLLESNIVRSIVEAGTWSGQPLTLTAAPPEGELVAVLLRADDGAILSAARL